jgi:hypothetical protein
MDFTDAHAEAVCKDRGYSRQFVGWLHEQESIGVYKGCIAFPVHNDKGQVVRIHFKRDHWEYYPKGGETAPLVVGAPIGHAAEVLAFESQWDAFAMLDKLGAHHAENANKYCAYITRGASSNTNFSKLAIPKLIACPQNDPAEKASKSTGRTPAEEWLFRIQSTKHKTTEFVVFETPSQHKDANDWIRADKPTQEKVVRMVIQDSKSPTPNESCPLIDQPPGSPVETDPRIPEEVFPIPAGGIGFTLAARVIFSVIGGSRRVFIREGVVCEVVSGRGEADYLAPVLPERFCNLVESFGYQVRRREEDMQKGTVTWRKATFPISSAKIILVSDMAGKYLPPIRQLTACPIFTQDGVVIGQGYHDHAGGTYVTDGIMPHDVPLDAAKTSLMGLLEDFNFTTPADKSRAMASLLSPALKMGGWIKEDFPLDVAEADQSQSGKTYRQKLVNRIYNEIPSAITAPRGGVGSLDETISAALIRGRPFITLDNFRGRLDSTILEQAIRGMNRVSCRELRNRADVDTQPFNWQLSTNGAEFTRDIANRSIITRIRKQPDGYAFRQHPEGDLLAHVAANQSFYLGAIFSVIREWARHDCKRSDEHRHDFRDWCRSLDWIVQNVFGLAPLLDGHREEQARTANPLLQWLRDVTNAARSANQLDRQLSTSQLVNIAEDAGIEFPGNPYNKDDPPQRTGKILGKLFKDADGHPITVDGFTVSREVVITYSDRGGEPQKFYTIRGNGNH